MSKLVKALAPVPFLGPKVSLFVSSSTTKSFLSAAKSKVKGVSLYSLKDGIPDIGEDTVCVITMPSSTKDYKTAQELAASSNVSAVVIVNALAKVRYIVTNKILFCCYCSKRMVPTLY